MTDVHYVSSSIPCNAVFGRGNDGIFNVFRYPVLYFARVNEIDTGGDQSMKYYERAIFIDEEGSQDFVDIHPIDYTSVSNGIYLGLEYKEKSQNWEFWKKKYKAAFTQYSREGTRESRAWLRGNELK